MTRVMECRPAKHVVRRTEEKDEKGINGSAEFLREQIQRGTESCRERYAAVRAEMGGNAG